jgi:hypothetical protein
MKQRKKGPPSKPGVADALFAKAQQRVLGVLFGNPRRSFYANEVIGLARSGTGAVQRELARLESAGLVTAVRIGKQKHYQANPASPVFPELRGLVLKTSGLADVLREGLAPVSNSIRVAFVYGSIAKGEDTAASDIDLMVVSDEPMRCVLLPYGIRAIAPRTAISSFRSFRTRWGWTGGVAGPCAMSRDPQPRRVRG